MHRLGKLRPGGLREEVIVTGAIGQIEAARPDRDFLQRTLVQFSFALVVFGKNLRLDLAILVVRKAQEDQSENRLRVLGRLQSRALTEIVRRLIAYFKFPNYYMIGGKPVFWLYRSDDFIAWEGVEKARARLGYLRDEVKKAGFPGLHLQISASAAPQRKVERLPEHIRDMGADSVTFYNWAYRTWDLIHSPDNPEMTYRAWGELALKNMAEVKVWAKKGGACLVPNITLGFNNCSRYPEPESLVRRGVADRTPQDFEAFARRVRKWADENAASGLPKLVIVNSWNEWTEDSYLEPDDEFGYGYLNAIWRVFGESVGK